jgi:putative phosphoribosyl transferase
MTPSERCNPPVSRLIRIPPAGIEGELTLPLHSRALVLFAHGSGSSRHSPRNRFVAERLHDAGLATLLLDLLTPAEDADPSARFNIPLLARRLSIATDWLRAHDPAGHLPAAFFGASTGAAAALIASVETPGIFAVVSRGGRPDLAEAYLPRVTAPVLLIVGGWDEEVLRLNHLAHAALTASSCARLTVVPGATHLFEEPGTLAAAAALAARWFVDHLPPRRPHP